MLFKHIIGSKYNACRGFLRCVNYGSVVLKGLQKYEPDRVDDFIKELPQLDENSKGDFISHIIKFLNCIFPIEDDWSYEYLMETDDDPYAMIEAQGPSINWDDYYEACCDPESVDPVSLFFQILGHGPEEYDWNHFNKVCGWGCEEEDASSISWNDPHWIDWNVFKSKLEEIDLGNIYALNMLENHDSNNPFIAFNPGDETMLESARFVLDSRAIDYYRQKYKEAEPIVEEAMNAWRMMKDDPSFYRIYYDLYKECMISEEKFYELYR